MLLVVCYCADALELGWHGQLLQIPHEMAKNMSTLLRVITFGARVLQRRCQICSSI
jgi:hypothetical protein